MVNQKGPQQGPLLGGRIAGPQVGGSKGPWSLPLVIRGLTLGLVVVLLGCQTVYLVDTSFFVVLYALGPLFILVWVFRSRFYWAGLIAIIAIWLLRLDTYFWMRDYMEAVKAAGSPAIGGAAVMVSYWLVDLLVILPVAYVLGRIVHRFQDARKQET